MFRENRNHLQPYLISNVNDLPKKHPFPAGKLPVRGKFRTTNTVIGSAAMTNVRRIQRYMVANEKQENEDKKTKSRGDITSEHKVNSFCSLFLSSIKTLVGELFQNSLCFSC